MLRTFVWFVFILPSFALAFEEIFAHKNASFDPDQSTIVSNDTNRNNYYAREGARTADSLPGVWVADLFYRALANFTIHNDVGTAACQKQTEMYLWHLRNNSYWAVKMYDSWSRYPNGILTGSTHQMGVYNECIDVHLPVQGKYCMSAVKLGTAANRSFDLHRKDEVETLDHAWNEILGYIFYRDQYRRNEVKIGICIPESCTAENLEISLQSTLDDIFLPHHVQPQVKVEPILCSTDKNMYPYETGYYVTKMTMFLVLIVCLISTLSHLIAMTTDKDKKSTLPEYFYWFSIIHNGRNLIKYDINNELNIFNGCKAIVMIIVIFGHKFLYYTMTPISYTMNVERIFKIGPDILLTCMNFVDYFFFISGFLMYVMIKPQLIKRGSSWIQIPMIIIYKYLRMMPAYGTMMLMTIYFIPYLNNGPFWASKVWPEAEKCKNYWWANLLAISNFIAVDNQCLVVGWYISCLIQFLVIGTIVIYICVKNHKLGTIVLSALLCVSLIIPFVLTYITRSYGIIRVGIDFLEKTSNSYEFEHLYGPFYVRGIPFYAGLLAGIVIEELKKRKIKLSKITIYVWTLVITLVCFWVQFYGAEFYKRHRPYNVIEQATYATLSHCTWTVMLFWITVCQLISGYGPIERVVNNRLMSILGRLSYTVYLVNISVIIVVEGRQSTSIAPTSESSIDGWIVGIVRSYLTGLALYLCVEAPFNSIFKKIFFGSKTDSSKENDKKITERRDSKPEITHCVSHL